RRDFDFGVGSVAFARHRRHRLRIPTLRRPLQLFTPLHDLRDELNQGCAVVWAGGATGKDFLKICQVRSVSRAALSCASSEGSSTAAGNASGALTSARAETVTSSPLKCPGRFCSRCASSSVAAALT